MNTRFAVAVHILTFLQTQDGQPAPSELIAGSVNTNPSLIRRLLSQLGKAGLTTSQLGTGGGALLARAGANISLLDVYGAMDEDGAVFGLHNDPNPKCMVGRNIQGVLRTRLDDAQAALRAELSRTTIADLARDMASRETQRSRISAS